MKKIILWVVFCLMINPCFASEITGTISNQVRDNELIEGTQENKPTPESSPVKSNQYIPNRIQVKTDNTFTKDEPGVKVLGLVRYPDGSLLRDLRGRIYFISGNWRKRILNLEELFKYKGQEIFDVDWGVIGEYQERIFGEGDLFRVVGSNEIYVIKNGQKWHIRSLEELRRGYFGKEITNVHKSE